jgi:hypothetical protein
MKIIKNLTRYGLLLLTISTMLYSCQPKAAADPTPKEVVPYEVSPNGEANLKVVNDYMQALLTNDQEKAKSLVGESFMSFGPSNKDSLNIEGVTSHWATLAESRSNQDLGIAAATSLRVNEGNLAGEWVHLWGDYSATLNDSDYVFDLAWHAAFAIKDNKIIYGRTWYNSLPIALDLGSVALVQAE